MLGGECVPPAYVRSLDGPQNRQDLVVLENPVGPAGRARLETKRAQTSRHMELIRIPTLRTPAGASLLREPEGFLIKYAIGWPLQVFGC